MGRLPFSPCVLCGSASGRRAPRGFGRGDARLTRRIRRLSSSASPIPRETSAADESGSEAPAASERQFHDLLRVPCRRAPPHRTARRHPRSKSTSALRSPRAQNDGKPPPHAWRTDHRCGIFFLQALSNAPKRRPPRFLPRTGASKTEQDERTDKTSGTKRRHPPENRNQKKAGSE